MAKAAAVRPSAVMLVNGPPVAAASTRASVQALTARLERVPQMAGAVSAYTSADPMLRAPNGHASLAVVSMRKKAGMMAQMMAVDAMCSPGSGDCRA